MTPVKRRTIIAHGRLALHSTRLAAARAGSHGLQVLTFEHLAARLAGGFARPIDTVTLRAAIHQVANDTPLGELEAIKTLPGFAGAAVDTLTKAWRAGLDLQSLASRHPRIQSMAALETALLRVLPPSTLRPTDLVARSLDRISHAPALFGPVDIVGITELSPCWRPLLTRLADTLPVRWIAGPRTVPSWLEGSRVELIRSPAHTPELVAVSAATALHEAIEAMRWARQLLASGTARPGEIAIASVSTADYDDHFLALRGDANLDLHFVHGVPVTASREGQACAALADVLVRGLSQSRLRRLAALLAGEPGPFRSLPTGWTALLPEDSPLTSVTAWTRLFERLRAEHWPDGIDHGPTLRALVDQLHQGVDAAVPLGETLLSGRAKTIWRTALSLGAPASIDLTLEALKLDDGSEACGSVAWMPASALAASPRRFVRLLGLTSSRWPRGLAEDRLLSDHIIATGALDPLPVGDADRRDFATILVTTERQVVLSRARRDSDGRLLGRSPLLRHAPAETFLARNRLPDHAFSETDRLLARIDEFRATPQAKAAEACWRNWHLDHLTRHDGLIRPEHPAVTAVLARTQSASSLRLLLRNPLGYLWRYALGLKAPESGTEPLVLDAPTQGELIHRILEQTVNTLEAGDGLAATGPEPLLAAISHASGEVCRRWEAEQPLPPALVWRRTLDEARELSRRALSYRGDHHGNSRSFAEVPFGGSTAVSSPALPWDATRPVIIPGTGLAIAGTIDRLDLAGDGSRAAVLDYKTGRPPKGDLILNGGKELQRCLYAFAAKALLGERITVTASLLYPREQRDLPLDQPEAVLEELTGHLIAARASLLAGSATLGIDSGGEYDELAFALPANAAATYCQRKLGPATLRLGAAATVWEAP